MARSFLLLLLLSALAQAEPERVWVAQVEAPAEPRELVLDSVQALRESGLFELLPASLRDTLGRRGAFRATRLIGVWAADGARIEAVQESEQGLKVSYGLGGRTTVHLVRVPRGGPVSFEGRRAPAKSTGLVGVLGRTRKPVPAELLRLEVRYDGGARTTHPVVILADDWERVRAIFRPPPADAAGERRCVELALAELERVVGPLTDTADDMGGFAGNISGDRLRAGRQMDCIDEATNATTYLRLLERDGLLRFHQPRSEHAERQQHWAGCLVELADGEVWAVDSWVGDNGQPAQVQRFAAWRRGRPYQPE